MCLNLDDFLNKSCTCSWLSDNMSINMEEINGSHYRPDLLGLLASPSSRDLMPARIFWTFINIPNAQIHRSLQDLAKDKLLVLIRRKTYFRR